MSGNNLPEAVQGLSAAWTEFKDAFLSSFGIAPDSEARKAVSRARTASFRWFVWIGLVYCGLVGVLWVYFRVL